MKAAERWVLIYYMSYDNNLDPLAAPILDGLQRGVAGSGLVVTVLVDDRDRRGLKRYAITGRGTEVERLATDDSSSTATFAAYLDWARNRYPADRYAVVFLDHGGRLDQMCLDDWPGEGRDAAWLSARAVADALREFRKALDGVLELLFLQQCGRGSIENLYNFRDTARVVLASQENVGAPNTYYEPTLKWLAAHPASEPAALARQIMASDEHYSSYVAVAGAALSELPRRLAPVVDALAGRTGAQRLPAGLQPSFSNQGEQNFDLFEWLESACSASSVPVEPLRQFQAWVEGALIVALSTDGPKSRGRNLSGLSLFVPASRQSWQSYAAYPLYRESSLSRLWEKIFGSEAPALTGGR